MIFNWFRNRRRAKLVARPFPDAWESYIANNVVHAGQLTEEQQHRLRRLIPVFVAEKNWEGCGGLTLTDEIRVTVAAQACLLVVGMPRDVYFDHVLSILVYPTGYVAAGTQITRAGLVIHGGEPRLGEAWWQGPVILSWSDVLAGGRMESPGHNLVLHEFAHQLDMMNGRFVDGTPLMETQEQFERWVEVLEPEFDRLVEDCRRGHHGFIDCYGSKNAAEFFAVLTEAFFERPRSLRNHHPAVYEVLRDFYHLDPAAWLPPRDLRNPD
ncbi:MAG: zinc-dependent peptidase [Planctomycetaceae bacterium]